MEPGYITTHDAAVELGVTPQRVRAMIRAGRLVAKTIGEGNRATHMIRLEDLDAVRDRKPGRPRKPPTEAAIVPKKKRGRPKGIANGK
jgi:hypothetical protein